jgi:hypothetical protein
MSLIPNYLYPHNCPLNFTGYAPYKIEPVVRFITDGTGTTGYIDLTPAEAKTFEITTSTTIISWYWSEDDYRYLETPVTVTLVSGNYRITIADRINDGGWVCLVYPVDDGKRFLQISVKDTVDNTDTFLVAAKIIEVAVDADKYYTFNANSYALQFLRAPELIYDNEFSNPNGGWLDIDIYITANTRLKTLCISVIDFTTINPNYVFVGWQAQGFLYYNDLNAAIPLGLSPVNVYSWLNEGNNYQIYIWIDIKLNDYLYTDIFGNWTSGKAPRFMVNRWYDNEGTYILNETFDVPANFSPISNPITCPVPYTYPDGIPFEPPASFTAPLLFNLNTNINIDNVALHYATGTDIAQPVLMWFNLMGGVEYQQLNVNEDGTIYKGKFSVKQNESVYYIDNANVKHEIANARVIDSMQLSVTLMRERTAQSDRLSQLAVSKNVYLFYGLGAESYTFNRTKVPLLAKRNSFVRFEGATTVQLTMEFDFAQDVDIKI